MLAKKNAQGHGYCYSDIAEITKMLAENGIDYYQETRTEDRDDYIYTIPIIEGKELNARRGCKLVKATLPQGKANPVQEYGSALTYARRYSLMMAFGIAPAEDDGESFTNAKVEEEPIKEVQTIRPIDVVALRMKADGLGYTEDQWCARYMQKRYEDLTYPEMNDLVKRMERAEASLEESISFIKEKSDGTTVESTQG